ncbi:MULTISPECIES: DNA polymerase beta superfamily protein [unclassified Streptomyces]|uniref:DNA polymerase beta superfamily protein n=1 Tax=unclassified Streptomyces TaxID=2593676 RepID=UPI003077CB96
MIDALDTDLASVVAEQPFPVLFATVSGAHLYGFPSRDSDVDLRGVHLLPAADLVGKPLLLTGIHLMRGGEVQPHLPTLLGEVDAALDYLPELIAAKAEREHGDAGVDHARVRADVERLHGVLDEAQAASELPDAPTAYDALHDFVVRIRLDRTEG